MIKEVQQNLVIRTSLDKLLNKIDCKISKDGKIEAVHDLLEQ